MSFNTLLIVSSARTRINAATSRTFYVKSYRQSTGTNIDPRLFVEMKPKVATLVETLYHFDTSQAYASIRSNAKLAETLLKDLNFVYPVRHSSPFGPKKTDPFRP